MPSKKTYKILVCPLDWGLGHATRCVPVIKELCAQGYHVIIGADKRPLDFLKNEFPNLEFVSFPGISISYPTNRFMVLKMILFFPRIIVGIYREHQKLKKIIDEYQIDYIISDNRYGLWHKKTPSVFMTHQIGIQTPLYLSFLKPILLFINKFFIHKHSQVWIPDFEGEPNLSGSLSHGYHLKIPVFFIGPLSRFVNTHIPEKKDSSEIVGIISGPEPQRTLFEKKLISEFKKHSGKFLIIKGMPELKETKKINNITIYTHLTTSRFLQLIKKASLIICRPGYSTIMDLAILNKLAVLIPTPGQTEQEYLANRYKKMGIFYSDTQSSFCLKTALNKYKNYSGINMTNEHKILKNCIKSLHNLTKK